MALRELSAFVTLSLPSAYWCIYQYCIIRLDEIALRTSFCASMMIKVLSEVEAVDGPMPMISRKEVAEAMLF